MQSLRNLIFERLGDFKHELQQVAPHNGSTIEEHAFFQVMDNLLEEAYFKMECMLHPQRVALGVPGVEDVTPDALRIDLPFRMFQSIANGAIYHADSNSSIILMDDGLSFQALVTRRNSQDCRQIFQSESIQ